MLLSPTSPRHCHHLNGVSPSTAVVPAEVTPQQHDTKRQIVGTQEAAKAVPWTWRELLLQERVQAIIIYCQINFISRVMHRYIKIARMGHGLERQQISPLIPPVLLVTFRTRRKKIRVMKPYPPCLISGI
jgi:hypothetical protein